MSDRDLESYWSCRSWYAEGNGPNGKSPTIGEAYDAGYKDAKKWHAKRNEELEREHGELIKHTSEMYDLVGGWYSGYGQ